MKKLKKLIRKTWYRLLDKQEPARSYSSRKKFKARYPNYGIGEGTYGLPHVHDWGEGTSLTIGAYCSISSDVHIFLGGNHRMNWVSTFPFPKYFPELNHLVKSFGVIKGDVIIGNDVWLGRNCTVLSGITIGDGAVIAASAVVTRDVPPYAIVAGNPAKIVRWRFDEATRRSLLDTAWWSWPADEIRQIANLLCKEDFSEFFAYAKKRSLNRN